MDENRIREIIKEELSEIDSRLSKIEPWVKAYAKHQILLNTALEMHHAEREEEVDINLTR